MVRYLRPQRLHIWHAMPALIRIVALMGLALSLTAAEPVSAPAAQKLTVAISQLDSSSFPSMVGYLTVLDEKSIPVVGLSEANFQVNEDGLPAKEMKVTSAVNAQEPLAATIAIDVSGSMQNDALRAEKDAAITFINNLEPTDQASVIAFGTGVRPLIGFTSDKAALIKTIQSLQAGGNTALYDALFTAVDAVSSAGPKRHIVVLMTDGQNTQSQAALDDGINLARQQGVPVHTIGLGSNVNAGVLDRIASTTGGSSLFAPTAADLVQAYQTVADQLRNQYVVSYTSPRPQGARTYRVSFAVDYQGSKSTVDTSYNVTPKPLTVESLSVADGQTIQGLIPVEAHVSSGLPIVKTTWLVNGRKEAEQAGPPTTFTVDTAKLSPGRHELWVSVLDSAGTQASKRVVVVVPALGSAPTAAAPASVGAPARGQGEPAGLRITQPAFPFWNAVAERIAPVTNYLSEHRKRVAILGAFIISGILATTQGWATVSILWKTLGWKRCSVCRKRYLSYKVVCPACQAEDRKLREEERTIGEFLVQNNLLDQASLDAAMAECQGRGKRLEGVLLDQGKVAARDLQKARFYLAHSVEIRARIQDLGDTKPQERMASLRPAAVLPHLSISLAAVAVSVLVLPRLW